MLMSLMRTISSTPYRHLLPNARRLTWVTHERDPATLAAFLGPSLRSFLITSHANNRSGIRATLGTLAAWLPESLEVLKMRFPNVANFYPELSGVLDTILRKHVHLKALELHLSFLEGVSPLTTLIERVPSQLQSLKLSHSIFASDMPPAMQVVASSLPNLRSLSLDLDIPSEGRVVRMELFQALLGIGNLVALELNLEPPLALSDSDVVSMGKAWPTLTDLKIYPSMSMASMHYHPFATSLSVLPIFADAFGTTLRHLGHNFTIPDGFPEALQGMIEGRRGFRKLQTLDLGTTIIPPIAVQGAAALIQAMCPSSTALQASRVSRKNSWMGLRSDEDWAAVRDDVDQIRRTGIVKKAPELSVDDDAARPSTSVGIVHDDALSCSQTLAEKLSTSECGQPRCICMATFSAPI